LLLDGKFIIFSGGNRSTGIFNMEKKEFYNNFVNEQNLINIKDSKIQFKFISYFFALVIFSITSGAIPQFVGYNFENAFAITFFVFIVSFLSLSFVFSFKLVFLDKKYGVFNKRIYSILFPFIFVFLSIIFIVISVFTTKFTNYSDGSFSISFNPFVFFIIYLPLFLGYLSFCYCAFLKCFAKYNYAFNKEK